ncbi:MAG: protein kinase [Desulfobacteraceae bacterium]|jgi:serine/threonine protein kinase/Flp pilus assembly protein TadD|nr:protein kinase [Desulfobacteraceae bacterium]
MTVFEPKKFGKYQLLDKIAVGGMAELFRAKLTGAQGFEKLIAVKKILPNLSREANLVTAFIDEAKLAALLHHENIIQIYDFGSMDDQYFIAMEYLFGKDLRTITRTARKKDLALGMENIVYIVSRICAGLDYSHQLRDLQGKPLNIIHRDINPQNILITYEGQVKIIDFGIAKAASHNTQTRENLIKGKLAYMSPEQANGQKIDHRSDIFSTGIILYELLAARRMFTGETMQVLSLVRDAQYDPPEEVIPDLPVKLNTILRRALAKDPDERYQSAGEMLADIEELMFELSLRPNARSFAGYIKELFEEEYAEEELALWARTQINEAGEPVPENEPVQQEGTYETTVILTKEFLLEKFRQFKSTVLLQKIETLKNWLGRGKLKKPNYRYVALIIGLVVLVVLADIGYKKLPFIRTEREAPAYPTQASAPAEPVEDIKIAAAKAALETKRYILAAKLFEEVLAGKPSMQKKVAVDYARALQGQANEIIKKDTAGAQKLLLKALEIDSKNISCLSQLGYIYMDRQDYPRAIDTYLEVTALAPQQPDAFFNLGYMFTITKNYQKAQVMYGRVVELRPAFTDEALFNLAVIHEKLGDRDRCINKLEQAVAFNPGNISAKKYLQKLKEKTGGKG